MTLVGQPRGLRSSDRTDMTYHPSTGSESARRTDKATLPWSRWLWEKEAQPDLAHAGPDFTAGTIDVWNIPCRRTASRAQQKKKEEKPEHTGLGSEQVDSAGCLCPRILPDMGSIDCVFARPTVSKLPGKERSKTRPFCGTNGRNIYLRYLTFGEGASRRKDPKACWTLF